MFHRGGERARDGVPVTVDAFAGHRVEEVSVTHVDEYGGWATRPRLRSGADPRDDPGTLALRLFLERSQRVLALFRSQALNVLREDGRRIKVEVHQQLRSHVLMVVDRYL